MMMVNYLVFVEIKNENIMNTVMKLLEDVNRIVKVESWSFEFLSR